MSFTSEEICPTARISINGERFEKLYLADLQTLKELETKYHSKTELKFQTENFNTVMFYFVLPEEKRWLFHKLPVAARNNDTFYACLYEVFSNGNDSFLYADDEKSIQKIDWTSIQLNLIDAFNAFNIIEQSYVANAEKEIKYVVFEMNLVDFNACEKFFKRRYRNHLLDSSNDCRLDREGRIILRPKEKTFVRFGLTNDGSKSKIIALYPFSKIETFKIDDEIEMVEIKMDEIKTNKSMCEYSVEVKTYREGFLEHLEASYPCFKGQLLDLKDKNFSIKVVRPEIDPDFSDGNVCLHVRICSSRFVWIESLKKMMIDCNTFLDEMGCRVHTL